MMGRSIIRSTSLLTLLIAITGSGRVAMAQASPEAVDDPPVAPEADGGDEANEGAETPPSLDDLLDLEGGADSSTDESAAELERRRTLDAALAEQEPEQAFRVAVTEMLESVDLLRDRRSTGLGTQRVQERIVDRLQVLIDSARQQRQQQQQQQQSSSSSSQQQQDPGRRSQEQQEGRDAQDARDAEGRNDGENQDGSSTQPPPPESTTLEGVLDESQVEWGSLPPRVRELITQGMRDQMSQLYRSLTEAYYRRMAEEADR
ncbi:MAG: hypothetical protein GY885_17545 [Phycisphaeraceae bacterium]|nr:hypothetical protein [Phycisphaeraceae bacterium]